MAGSHLSLARVQASPLPARFVATKPGRSRAQPLYKLTSEFWPDGEVDFLSSYYGFFRSQSFKELGFRGAWWFRE
jgi:hypothetical protein